MSGRRSAWRPRPIATRERLSRGLGRVDAPTPMNGNTGSEIRSAFLRYFKERGHVVRPSSSLIPDNDPSLVFTNAGMVQFKGVFLGREKVDFLRAATSQRCVRAGGKHNDLEEVGKTTRHHTFFEMLGNFSFGDYFKREAVGFAWELVTEVYGLDPDRLYATVHLADDEAAKLWSVEAGIPPARIHRLGDKDNFWQMAETGPCGPCSELHYDLRPSGAGVPRTTEEFVALNEAGSILELWNLVFMQFDRDLAGNLTPLPARSVDTGAGLERIAAVLQGADSNFHTDLFAPLLECISDLVGRAYDPRGEEGTSFRVLADHARAVTFLLADGVVFQNDGRGYVLRRILRRAVRHAWLLGRRSATLAPVVGVVVDTMAEAFPELDGRREELVRATAAEEARFFATVEGGIVRLEKLFETGSRQVAGEDAFKLYDTYGFPLDLTRLIAAERGFTVDEEGFRSALKEQRERSRQSGWRGAAVEGARLEWRPALGGLPEAVQSFVGYASTDAETEVVATSGEGGCWAVILAENPFYREAGGQVSDSGTVRGHGWRLRVDSVEEAGGMSALVGVLTGAEAPPDGSRTEGSGSAAVEPPTGPVRASVDRARRLDIQRNHTATHLLHAALRKLLGPHVRQKGSLVAPDRLRFDFSHPAPVSDEERARIEEEVNRGIWSNRAVVTEQRSLEDAKAAGAMALFGEKYADEVRVVEIEGISLELCGGTHVANTGEIGSVRIVSESGVASGVRRIEALTGRGAFVHFRKREELLESAARRLRVNAEGLLGRVESLVTERNSLEKLLTELRMAEGSGAGTRELASGELSLGNGRKTSYAGVRLSCHGAADARSWGDRFLAKTGSGAAVLAADFSNGKHSLFVFASTDLVARGFHAGRMVREIAALTGGRGGGRPHMAQAGVGDPALIDEALRATGELVRRQLGAADP